MTTATPEIVEVLEQPTAVVRGRVPLSELPAFFDRSFGTLDDWLGRHGIEPSGPAFARYAAPPSEAADLEVGFPVRSAIKTDGSVEPSTLPAGTAARAVHAGAYDGLGDAWGALAQWIAAEGRAPGAALWEVYLTEPTPDMDPADLRTELTWLLE